MCGRDSAASSLATRLLGCTCGRGEREEGGAASGGKGRIGMGASGQERKRGGNDKGERERKGEGY